MSVPPDGQQHGRVSTDVSDVLVRASSGDAAAWRALVDLYARRIYALAQSRLRNQDMAEEITQSVFATLAAKLAGGGYREQGKFEPWLFRIAANRIRDEVRRRRRSTVHSETDVVARIADGRQTSTEPAANAADASTLRAALDRLGESDREVIELRHHGGLSFQQMSELLEEPLGTLLARHHRALGKLRGIVESLRTGGSPLGKMEA